MSRVVDSLQAGREAFARNAWREAYERLREEDRERPLAVEDLERLSDAAFWSGRLDEAIGLRERLYKAHLQEGNPGRAAYEALMVADSYMSRMKPAVAKGWWAQAERLLADLPEAVEHGYMEVFAFWADLSAGRLDAALERARRAIEIGRRFGDRDLEVFATHQRGMALVRSGEVEPGMALIDEASAAAVAGELSPMWTGLTYCCTISACRDVGDFARAGEWTEMAHAWCERLDVEGFPGICRVHRAEVMRVRGLWEQAEQECRRACEELEDFSLVAAGWGYYELGEIRLRIGDLAGAEEAFRKAHELGRNPQPGLALLRLAQGKPDAAAKLVQRALDDESCNRLTRVQLLPAKAEIAVAAGDVAGARAAADELAELAATFGSTAFAAEAATATGRVFLAEGDPAAAQRELARALRLWHEIDAPYEAARTRVVLARAYRADDDEDSALLELGAAKSVFERLGALPALRETVELLEPAAGSRARKAFLFTDIVRSTDLLDVIGDRRWHNLLRRHDDAIRAVVEERGGSVVNKTGDGFFVTFDDVDKALDAAIAVQRVVEREFPFDVRIGVHAGEATETQGEYHGKGVHAAARIGALAGGGEILVSRETAAASTLQLELSDGRREHLKGFREPVELVSLLWDGNGSRPAQRT